MPSSASSLPLDFCADDCDSVEVWARGLTCFQRLGYTAVSGWMGQEFGKGGKVKDKGGKVKDKGGKVKDKGDLLCCDQCS